MIAEQRETETLVNARKDEALQRLEFVCTLADKVLAGEEVQSTVVITIDTNLASRDPDIQKILAATNTCAKTILKLKKE
ncbi:MAG TPA: hypothetical protein PK765_01040 [bacterium]|nr:hypothetical protein [bacterium]